MRFSTFAAIAFATLSSVVSATDPTDGFDPISVPTLDQTIAYSSNASLDITWEYSAKYPGTVTITLLQGATTNSLSLGDVVKAGIDNSLGTYTWAIPSTLGSYATYGFQISNDTNTTCFQYSYPFHITGLPGAASSTTSELTGTPVTTTIQLSTGTAYVASTSSFSSNTSTIVTSTSYSNTSTSASLSATVSPSSNLSTVTAVTTVPAKTSSPVSTSATGTAAPTHTSAGAAVANVARGSFALFGGLVLALAL